MQNTTFVNYQDNDLRKTGALSWLMFTSSGVTTGSTISGAKYINAKPVYFPKIDQIRQRQPGWRGPDPVDPRPGRLDDGHPDSHIILHDGENDSVVTDEHLRDPADLERFRVHGRCRSPESLGQ